MTARFRRRAGTVSARFSAGEADVLRQVVGEVLELLGGPSAGQEDVLVGRAESQLSADPVLARLFPDGYRDDPQAAGELRRLTESSLRAEKVRNAQAVLDALPETGGTVRLPDDDAVDAWLRAINDVRLALGTRLGVTDDLVEAGGPAAYAMVVYQWLGWLQETLVRPASPGG